ncbi:MAG TPA: cytochrome C oxidase subunit IV family protein [Thermoanaerobaculia bacterium]|jgi:caa(3)-type oxidase subunit IV
MTEHASHESHDTPGTAAAPADHRRDYFRIFWVLLVLTIVEVAVSYLKIDKRLMSVTMIALALTKAAFVGLYYMHLKYEKRSLLWLAALPLPLAGFYAVFLMLDGANLLRATTLPWIHH